MKANELRIGNWIDAMKGNFFDRKGFVQVSSIDNYGINDWQDMGASGSLLFDYINGIPLTPEILESCGFEKFSAIGLLKCYAIMIDKENEIELLITVGQQYAFMELPGWQNQNNKLNYLHQLQNLYFALTGEELTVNLHVATAN